MGRLTLSLLAAVAFASISLQQKDPVNDFCRIWGHQTTVIDRKLYRDGGLVDWNPIPSNPGNFTNTYLLYNDLDVTQNDMPQLHANLSKNSTVPDVSGGILWADTTNKVFYQYGGEFTGNPAQASLWAYDAVYNQWNNTPNDPSLTINRASWGAGTAVNARAEGYYLGGYLNSANTPGWTGPQLTMSNLLKYNMVQNKWTNTTGPDSQGRAEGVMTFIPASDSGLLIYFGGIIDPGRNGTIMGSNMSTIYVYDIASTKWYTQTASGDVPEMRRKFCAGATWAADKSSYNIYLYGGQGITNITGFDDVYILSIPSFTWIKWYPSDNGTGNPHGMLTCNVISGNQMLIIGGYAPGNQDCDTPDQKGTHNLVLGENGPNKAKWDVYDPTVTQYQVPTAIISAVGGGPTGGATNTKPATWDNRDLSVYFTRQATFSARTATRTIPTSTASATSSPSGKSNTGAIAGGVVGGVVGLALIIGLVYFCCLRRRKSKNDEEKPKKPRRAKKDKTPPAPPVELPGESIPEMSANHPSVRKTHPRSPNIAAVSPYSQHAPSVSPGAVPPYEQQHPAYQQPQQNYFPNAPVPSPITPQIAYSHVQPPTSHPAQYSPPIPTFPHQHAQQLQLQNAQPYDPAQNPLHQQHFPPPPQTRGSWRQEQPSPDERDSHSSASNTPAHFYPQPLSVPRNVSASTGRTSPRFGRFLEHDEQD